MLAWLKRAVTALAFAAIGVGFWAIGAWGYRHGLSAGSLGGVTRDESPGVFWFLLFMNGLYGGVFLAHAVTELAPSVRRYTRPLWVGVVISVLALGAWAGVALAWRFVSSAAADRDPVGRWFQLGGGLMVVGVFFWLLYSLWGDELGQLLARKKPRPPDGRSSSSRD
jgi:hypothetical protein